MLVGVVIVINVFGMKRRSIGRGGDGFCICILEVMFHWLLL